MGPIDIFLRLVVDSFVLGNLEPSLLGDLALSIAFNRELAVVAMDTGCRGRELRKGGDSFGG